MGLVEGSGSKDLGGLGFKVSGFRPNVLELSAWGVVGFGVSGFQVPGTSGFFRALRTSVFELEGLTVVF